MRSLLQAWGVDEWHRLAALGTRPEQRVMAMLRLGHSPLNRHRHRLGRADSPLCACGNEVETVSHFLLRCPRWGARRGVMLSQVCSLTGMPLRDAASESVLLAFAGLKRECHQAMTSIVAGFAVGTGRLGWLMW